MDTTDINNLYNFKNPIKHFFNIDNLIFPNNFESIDDSYICWTKPIKFKVKKNIDSIRTLKIPNILNFIFAYNYYKELPYFFDLQGMDISHKRMSANLKTGDFIAGEYDRQLEDDFSNLCIYDYMIKIDIREFYGRICTHNLDLSRHGLKDRVLSSMNDGLTNGLLMGNYLSLYFAEGLLSEISRKIQEELENKSIMCGYSYFSDDFYFFCNKSDIESIVSCFEQVLDEFDLIRNDSKLEIFNYQDYNEQNLLTRYWKKILKICNESYVKDFECVENYDSEPIHRLVFLNQLIYRMSNISDERLRSIFINNFFKTKYFKELDLNTYEIMDYDYHQLCFLLKCSPESILYAAYKFSHMSGFDKNLIKKFLSIRFEESLKYSYYEEQLYYFYGIKVFGFYDILVNKKYMVLSSKNQILISYYLKDNLFDEEDKYVLKSNVCESYWLQNYHLILTTPELLSNLDESINKYLIPQNAKKEKQKKFYLNFYRENLSAKNSIILDISNVQDKINNYLDLRHLETEDF